MSSYKQLNKADVTTVDYHANKKWNFTFISGSDLTGSNITFYKGKKETFNKAGNTTTNLQYKSSIYDSINHTFYQAYSGSLDTGSLMFNTFTYESASQQRRLESYFNYNINPLLIKNFPIGNGSEISVLNIDQGVYGSKVLPHSFRVSSSTYFMVDDGNGNLFDIAGFEDDYIELGYISQSYFNDTSGSGIVHVGNIFYAHGIAVITDPNYQLSTKQYAAEVSVGDASSQIANISTVSTVYPALSPLVSAITDPYSAYVGTISSSYNGILYVNINNLSAPVVVKLEVNGTIISSFATVNTNDQTAVLTGSRWNEWDDVKIILTTP